ncbi:hypothetical protein LPJ74_006445, partial [Coemansia sp. RSA 1843]
TTKKPSPPDENDARKPHEQMDCNIFIKNAWTEAPENAAADGRDEARHLKSITARLKDIASVEGMYPKLYEGCNSGRVRFTDPVSGISYENTSKTVLGDDVWGQLVDRNTALRVHKHMYTRGIGKPINKTRPDKTGSGKAPKKLHRWHQGTLEEIADAKRADLHDKKHFQNIISEFNRGLKNIDLLFGLVEKLRYVLIDEHPDKLRGALKDMDMQSNTETGMLDIVVLSDPFEERAAKWKELSESLLTVLEDSAQQTRERLRKYF